MKGLLQLFSQMPPEALFLSVAEAFGGNNFDTQFTFNIYDVQKLNTVEKMREHIPEFQSLYLPCKSRMYIHPEKWTMKSCINILRHFGRLKNGQLLYQEKLKGGVKFIQYTYYPSIAEPDKPTVISFD